MSNYYDNYDDNGPPQYGNAWSEGAWSADTPHSGNAWSADTWSNDTPHSGNTWSEDTWSDDTWYSEEPWYDTESWYDAEHAPPPPGGPAPGADALPIERHREAILRHVAQHLITFIQGETGCGKSSMVPQFLLRHDPGARIFVTQPRRFAAISLADHVGKQLGDPELVGYRLGQGRAGALGQC